LSGAQRGGHSHQRSVAAIHTDGIGDQVKFCPILASHGPVVCPIPVEHELPLGSLGNDVAIGRERRASWRRNRNSAGLNRRPAGAREAILWGMDSIACALTGKICQKQIYIRASAGIILIDAKQEISLPQHIQHILGYSDVRSAPLPQLLWKGLKRLPHRQEFISAAGVKKNRGDRQQRGRNEETRAGIHARTSFPRVFKSNRRCKAKSMASDTTKMSQPEKA